MLNNSRRADIPGPEPRRSSTLSPEGAAGANRRHRREASMEVFARTFGAASATAIGPVMHALLPLTELERPGSEIISVVLLSRL